MGLIGLKILVFTGLWGGFDGEEWVWGSERFVRVFGTVFFDFGKLNFVTFFLVEKVVCKLESAIDSRLVLSIAQLARKENKPWGALGLLPASMSTFSLPLSKDLTSAFLNLLLRLCPISL